MEGEGVVKFMEGKSILITGATGFLAKMLVEKILRIQPNIKRIFLLIRSRITKSATQRLHEEVINIDLFNLLREKYEGNLSLLISEKVFPVSGDISLPNLGIDDYHLRTEMFTDIDVIINSAATTKFDERYDVALDINTFGVMHVLNFAKRCSRLQVLLHISTAYVCGQQEGSIEENEFQMGETPKGVIGLDIEVEKKLVEGKLNDLRKAGATDEVISTTMRDMGIERAKQYGWPNTYVFTKAMGEMILGHTKQSLAAVIIRPSVVTSTYKEPFPGWIEGFRTIDSFIVGYAKGKLGYFFADPKSIIDIIPGDMVVNAVLVAMVRKVIDDESTIIYHLSSSSRNPMTFGKLSDACFRYFTDNPWVDRKGNPIKVSKIIFLRTTFAFRFYMGVHYVFVVKVLTLVNVMLCQHLEDITVDQIRRLKLIMRLWDLYKPYILFKGIFDDHNTEKLRMEARRWSVDDDVFCFDPTRVDWESYFMNIHFNGVGKYVRK